MFSNVRRIRHLILCMMVAYPAFGQNHSHPAVDSTRHNSIPGSDDRFEGTRRMIGLLEEVNRVNYCAENPYANAARVEYYRTLAAGAPGYERLKSRELLNAGLQDEAISDLLAAKARHAGNGTMVLSFDRLLALAYLRQGELNNCVENHTSQSCIFPIGEGGFYKDTRGPRAAIEVLDTILDRDPNDLLSLWLLNIACMTIGTYPDSVPEHRLLPPGLFESGQPFPRFTNIAPQLGIADMGLAGGSCTEDFDRDGDIDIVTSSWGMKSPMYYYRNNGDGTFTDATGEARLDGLTGGLNMIHGDYDNDGYPDILVLRGGWFYKFGKYPNSLLRNNGDGTFSDVTIEAGILSYHPTQTAVFADLNNDGWLDIFIGNESAMDPHTCELFVSNGDGTFTERAREVGVDMQAFVKGVTGSDYDNDGDIDLYLSCLGSTNHLLKNNWGGRQKKWTFTNVTTAAGVGAPVQSFPTFFFDYDNDGWDDIFVSSYDIPMGPTMSAAAEADVLAMIVNDYLGVEKGERSRLYHNNRNGTFTNVAKEAGTDAPLFGMGCNFGDIDNDGYLDMYIGTGIPQLAGLMPNRMFRNGEGKKFLDVTTAGGFGHLQKGHAVSFADLDNDGDQDIYEVMGGAFEGDLAHKVLFENPGNGNHWISLTLEGVRSNRSAIGARILVVVETPGGERAIHMSVSTGGSFGSSTLQQEIGLGDATAIRSITITWPASKTKQVFKDVAMDGCYEIREDAKAPVQVERKHFTFKTDAMPEHHHH